MKDVLIRSASEYNQIVQPSSMQDVVYTELHKKMGHLGSEKVADLYGHWHLYYASVSSRRNQIKKTEPH